MHLESQQSLLANPDAWPHRPDEEKLIKSHQNDAHSLKSQFRAVCGPKEFGAHGWCSLALVYCLPYVPWSRSRMRMLARRLVEGGEVDARKESGMDVVGDGVRPGETAGAGRGGGLRTD
eukprot:3322897-Pleurochrysis_carterae.AAC.1